MDFEHSSHELNRPEAKRFRVKLANLNTTKTDLIEVLVDLLEAENLKSKNLADEYPSFVPTESVSPDKSQAVFFAFVHSTQEGRSFPRLQLLGLDPNATYSLGSIEGKAAEGTPAEASGAWWMNHGIEMALSGDFQGAAFRLDRK